MSTVSSWYGGLKIPTLGSDGFAQMASKGAILTEAIAGRSFIPIQVKNERTASVDLSDPDKPKITLPRWYFDPGVYSTLNAGRFGSDEDCALSMINGSLIHESLHIALTKQNLDKMLKTDSRVDDDFLKRYGKFAFTVMNIIEDIYIESRTIHRNATWKLFLNDKNSVLFQRANIAELLNSFKGRKPSASEIIGILAFLKNKALDHELYTSFKKYAEMITLAKEPRSLSDGAPMSERAKIAVDIILSFDGKDDAHPEPSEAETEPGSDGKPDSGSGGDGETGSEEMEAAIESSIASTDPTGELERVAAAFERAIKMVYTEGVGASAAVVFHVVDILAENLHEYTRIKDTTLYTERGDTPTFPRIYDLAKKLKFRDRIKAPGAPQKSGPIMLATRLNRATIDGKIFAPVSEKTVQPPEVGILIDASGSMRHEVEGPLRYSKGIHTLFGACSRAAEELHDALGSIPHFVVAHTSRSNHGALNNEGVLFKVAAYGMRSENTPRSEDAARFKMLSRVGLSQNFDGYAIAESAKFFTHQHRAKVLIVLSDGAPAALCYGGDSAIRHTQREIGKLRQNGIKVISISLVPNVMSTNNKIYGPQFNIDGTGEMMASSIANIINNLIAWRA